MFAVAQCLKNHTSVMNDGVFPEDGDGGQQNRGGQQQNRQENGAGGQVDKQVDGGEITRGWGEGEEEEVFGEGEGGKGGIGADLKVME